MPKHVIIDIKECVPLLMVADRYDHIDILRFSDRLPFAQVCRYLTNNSLTPYLTGSAVTLALQGRAGHYDDIDILAVGRQESVFGVVQRLEQLSKQCVKKNVTLEEEGSLFTVTSEKKLRYLHAEMNARYTLQPVRRATHAIDLSLIVDSAFEKLVR